MIDYAGTNGYYLQNEVWSLVAVVVLVELLHADVRYAGAVHLQLDAVAPETVLHVVHGRLKFESLFKNMTGRFGGTASENFLRQVVFRTTERIQRLYPRYVGPTTSALAGQNEGGSNLHYSCR